MAAASDRLDARLIVAAILTLIVSACGGQTTTSTATSTPSSSPTSAAATPSVIPNVSGKMTGDELVWLEGISALHKTMDKAMNDMPATVTDAMLRRVAKQLADCTPALDRLGSTTERLQPVRDLARQACAQYEKAAKCFAAAKGCGFDELSKGSSLFAEAEIKGSNIKDAAH
jgi:hypothetical protein